ncbi:MAG: hypothetical protein UV61_C0002G0162 [Candidatus Gottesmanbacteria bacterium GW2011_GWB1_43_11]|uniref:Glycosyltransferase RgtA/B/C/D-like domain-containing protein n=1 Tax=Candidatus Gottesmanbacteria bacterium GW2011_GWB1_43_11 TaxID=1618446 RepID=A0A0G1EWP4_9BACT|nr:MAG: hypothetical protein UV04_C0001G0050 [Candidatus Gottesmanbacteria bacterium GW2011_GWA2_42_16]KKS56239.1 MAG: hypothetical protein UV17_C0001G0049 [Candidatus Gottesmanbacteria bacterium GW2011_GWA1_42_26]KKS82572.1 MAG: hypothetical protein UV55_C0001G0032 [Candidatus Gottesmanbacteria bacterium GW2011_GWC1_43_10]KKS87441.1 MAG: hypothetical protein UV61_C0002G0162 [Candidatus Gottesmanbacteria bacterium GW2011_GWB1_43_11]OGG10184.1 MAG: hypothetical protein A2699_01395 [Candidatus Go
MNKLQKWLIQYWNLILILVLAVILLTVKLDKKFMGQHDWNSTWYGNVARNHIRYGLANTKLGSISAGGPIDFNSSRLYFTHYPPLFPLLLALGFKLFGPSEVALRLVVIFFSLWTIVFIYLLAKLVLNKTVAFLASIFAVVTPLFLYYGKLPVHEPIILPFILAGIYFYLRWFKDQKSKNLILSASFLFLAELITWPAYFVPPLLTLHYWLFHPQKKHLKLLLLLPLIMIGVFMLHLMHVKLLTGSFLGGGLVQIFLTRIQSKQTNEIYRLTFFKYLTTEIQYLKIYFTNILLVLDLGWVIHLIIRYQKRQIALSESLQMLLLIFGSAYVVIFQEAAFLHDYLIYYLLPFIVIAAAQISEQILRRLTKNWRLLVAALLVLLVATERLKYAKAILNSNNSEKGYKIGEFINRQTSFNDLVLVGSNFYGDFYASFIAYYGDRSVGYSEDLKLTDLDKFQWVVRPKAHDALSEKSKAILDKKFPRYENAEFVWYDLRKKT